MKKTPEPLRAPLSPSVAFARLARAATHAFAAGEKSAARKYLDRMVEMTPLPSNGGQVEFRDLVALIDREDIGDLKEVEGERGREAFVPLTLFSSTRQARKVAKWRKRFRGKFGGSREPVVAKVSVRCSPRQFARGL